MVEHNLFLIKERINILKAACDFDVYDPLTGNQIIACREPNIGSYTKLLRFTPFHLFTPFDVQVKTPEGMPILRISQGVTFITSKVAVYGANNEYIGGVHQPVFSWKNIFKAKDKIFILDKNDQICCQIEGNWSRWEFNFMREGVVIARASKKWAGIGKELFTRADNYMLTFMEDVEADDSIRQLVLAAILCINLIYPSINLTSELDLLID